MKNIDETKEAVRFLLEYEKSQERRFADADRRVEQMRSNLPEVRGKRPDDLQMWLW